MVTLGYPNNLGTVAGNSTGVTSTRATMKMNNPPELWGIIELFGHQQIAGQLTEVAQFGGAFLRVNIPQIGDKQAQTSDFGSTAIYAITYTAKETALAYAARITRQPVNTWDARLLITAAERKIEHYEEPDDENITKEP